MIYLDFYMKKLAYLVYIPMFLWGCQTGQTQPQNPIQGIDLKQPEAKVLCDQYICANAEGLSKVLTEKYLGQAQAERVFSQAQLNQTQFTFANGIFCDTQAKRCHVDRYFDANGKRSAVAPNYTQALFGQ